ncbi:MAG: hypothetical protein AAAC47_26165 [Pararhizobium sp.]
MKPIITLVLATVLSTMTIGGFADAQTTGSTTPSGCGAAFVHESYDQSAPDILHPQLLNVETGSRRTQCRCSNLQIGAAAFPGCGHAGPI